LRAKGERQAWLVLVEGKPNGHEIGRVFDERPERGIIDVEIMSTGDVERVEVSRLTIVGRAWATPWSEI